MRPERRSKTNSCWTCLPDRIASNAMNVGAMTLNLGNRLDGLQEAIDWGQFVDVVAKVASTGRQDFLNLPGVVDRVGYARRACEHDVHVARRGLAVRRDLLGFTQVWLKNHCQMRKQT